jgi:hypothetical protein
MKIDLSPKQARCLEEIEAIISAELARFKDPSLVRALRSFLIIPRMELRSWDWAGEHPELPGTHHTNGSDQDKLLKTKE